jgi:hypothetical protein
VRGSHTAALRIPSAPPPAAWLASPGWEGQLERLLAVRQPSEEDLKEVRGHAARLAAALPRNAFGARPPQTPKRPCACFTPR